MGHTKKSRDDSSARTDSLFTTVELQYNGQPTSALGSKKSGILELSAIFGPFFLLYEKNGHQRIVRYVGIIRYFWTPINWSSTVVYVSEMIGNWDSILCSAE